MAAPHQSVHLPSSAGVQVGSQSAGAVRSPGQQSRPQLLLRDRQQGQGGGGGGGVCRGGRQDVDGVVGLPLDKWLARQVVHAQGVVLVEAVAVGPPLDGRPRAGLGRAQARAGAARARGGGRVPTPVACV